jgi:hypothetical protein
LRVGPQISSHFLGEILLDGALGGEQRVIASERHLDGVVECDPDRRRGCLAECVHCEYDSSYQE